MNLLFIHDCQFFRDNDLYYVVGGLRQSVWHNNYLPYFDNITVIGRQTFSQKSKIALSSVDDDRVNFSLIPEYSSIFRFFIHYGTIKQKIKNEIEKTDFTIIRMPSQFSFAAFDILRKLNRPFLVEVVENAFEGYWYYPSFYGKLCAHYFNNKMKTVLQHAPYAVYVAQKLQKDYPTNGHSAILSNVLIEQILAVDKIENSRFNDAHFKIGLIGDMGVKYKGHSTLLKAVSLLDATVKPHIELYFIGAGNHEWITVLAKKLHLNKNIKFIGPLPHDKVIIALQTLSLYVHPSFKEGLPRALLEAMSMGCPVLGSTNGGIPEVVKPEFLHKPGDYRTLAKQIKRFYDDRKLLKQEGLFNLENVKPFSKKDLGKRRFDFYSQLINKTE